MKRAFVTHPFLFAIFPVMFLFSHNIGKMALGDIILPVGVLLVFTAVFFIPLGFIIRDFKKAGVIVSIFMVLFFSYGHIFDMALKVLPIGQFKHRSLLAIFGIIFISTVFFTLKRRKNLDNPTMALNIVSFSLIAISFFNIAAYKFKTKDIRQYIAKGIEESEERAAVGPAVTSGTNRFRDIYYIILDGYGNEGSLEEACGYDNHEFKNYLTKTGFYVASKSRTNYVHTFLSLASSLNMKYINYLSDILGKDSKNSEIPDEMIRDNEVVRFLKSKGYMFIYISSGWQVTKDNPYTDLTIDTVAVNEFISVLIEMSILRPFSDRIKSVSAYHYARKRILTTFSELAKIPDIKKAKFVFAHVVAPHPPYVFDANGKPVKGIKEWDNYNGYLNQLIFVNKKVEELVDRILAGSDIAPIIILQGDHGPWFIFNDNKHREGMDSYTYDYMADKEIKVRTGILNAYYLPDGGSKLLYDSISPVNTFRVIFNTYFDIDYGLLGDKVYCSSDKPYDFVDVTERLKS